MIHKEIKAPVKDDKWHSFDQMAFSFSEFENNLYDEVLRPNFLPPQVHFFFSFSFLFSLYFFFFFPLSTHPSSPFSTTGNFP